MQLDANLNLFGIGRGSRVIGCVTISSSGGMWPKASAKSTMVVLVIALFSESGESTVICSDSSVDSALSSSKTGGSGSVVAAPSHCCRRACGSLLVTEGIDSWESKASVTLLTSLDESSCVEIVRMCARVLGLGGDLLSRDDEEFDDSFIEASVIENFSL